METTTNSEYQPYFWAANLIIFYTKASHPHSELSHPYLSWGIQSRNESHLRLKKGQPYRGRGIPSKCIRFSESALWSAIEKCALLFWGLFPIKCRILQAQTIYSLVFLKLIWSKWPCREKIFCLSSFWKLKLKYYQKTLKILRY
jgi:hypothetical protein